MQIERKLKRVLNEQFNIIGAKITFEEIPEDGIVEVGKKKFRYWDVYKFKDREQYEKWRKWAEEQLPEENMDLIDLTWGLNFVIKKESGIQTTLF